MNNLTNKPIYLFLAAIIVAGLGMSSHVFASVYTTSVSPETTSESCCQVGDAPSCSEPLEASQDAGCCPEPEPGQECPCACTSCCCKVMTRTVSLFASQVTPVAFFESSVQVLRPMPRSLPASAVLSVDIQPPIV